VLLDNTNSNNMIDDEKREERKPPIIMRWDSPWTIVKDKTMCGFHYKMSEGNFWIPIKDADDVERRISICQDCMIKVIVDEHKKRHPTK
jgi:hypothetical protein